MKYHIYKIRRPQQGRLIYNNDADLSVKTMFVMAVATSIDALAVGITFALLPEVNIGAAVGFIGCLAGDYLGRKVFDKLDAQKLKYVIYIGMIISGVLMLF